MLTILSFFITLIGGINWLMIGLLQYDFIAGIFGYQASIFSRLIYIVFGLSGIIVLFKLIKGKGTIAVFSRRNKKDLKKNIEKINDSNNVPAHANVESSNEFKKNDDYNNFQPSYNPSQDYSNHYPDLEDDSYNQTEHDGLFDEHLGRR